MIKEPKYTPLPVKFAQAERCEACGKPMKGSKHHEFCNKCHKKIKGW